MSDIKPTVPWSQYIRDNRTNFDEWAMDSLAIEVAKLEQENAELRQMYKIDLVDALETKLKQMSELEKQLADLMQFNKDLNKDDYCIHELRSIFSQILK